MDEIESVYCMACGDCRYIYEIVSAIYDRYGRLIIDGLYTECKSCH